MLLLFILCIGKEVVIPIELELNSLRLSMQDEELNFDNIPQRVLSLLELEEQHNHSLDNIKRVMQKVKNFFENKSTFVNFIVD